MGEQAPYELRGFEDARKERDQIVDQIIGVVETWCGSKGLPPMVMEYGPVAPFRSWLERLLDRPMGRLAAHEIMQSSVPTEEASQYAQAHGAIPGDHVWRFVLKSAVDNDLLLQHAEAVIMRSIFGWKDACSDQDYAKWCHDIRDHARERARLTQERAS